MWIVRLFAVHQYGVYELEEQQDPRLLRIRDVRPRIRYVPHTRHISRFRDGSLYINDNTSESLGDIQLELRMSSHLLRGLHVALRQHFIVDISASTTS